jgi:tetratricopeptide (TPR) repeat protein
MSSANTPTIGPLDPRDATPLPLEPGDVVAERYEVLRLLGSGGSAYVYAVRDRRIGDEIALKLLRGDVDVARSRREAELARGSSSSRLVRAFDLVEADGLVFLTMELVPGGSLRDRLRREPLPVDEAIRLAGEILEALADLHALDIVHRDLKPGNLLLTADDHLKLSDFGIARRWTDEESRLTVTGATLGTIDYLSPEQAIGEDVDPRSDLYSFGVLLYEMLTGHLPFEAPSKVAAIGMRLQRRPADVRALRPDTPRWLAAIVARLLQTKREDRYPSAQAVLRDLRRRRVQFAKPRLRTVALLAILAVVTGIWWRTRPVAADFAADGDWGMRGVDRGGTPMWERPDTRPTHAVFVQRGRRREIAAILAPSDVRVKEPAFGRTLSFLDPQTGNVLRTSRVPAALYDFPDHSDRFGVAQIRTTDVDHDGYEEVAIVYAHDYWPSFVVLHDLRRDESRVVFVASGHHTIKAVADVDGDRVDDLIMVGTANKQGWYVGVAAVRVLLNRSRYSAAAHTPDRMQPGPARIWYALLPAGPLDVGDVTVDSSRRVIRLHYGKEASYPLTYDGFRANSRTRLTSAERERARERAYEHLRNARRFTPDLALQAVQEADRARVFARDAGDATLAEWSSRVKAVAQVHAGWREEATASFTQICANPEIAPDAAWDAGNAFHLAGDLPTAVEWYRRALGPEGHPGVGRLKYEALQGLVFALGEMGRWNEAIQAIDQFGVTFPNEGGAENWYRSYVLLRTGGAPPIEYDPHQPTDPYRYWALESALARNLDPKATLDQINMDQQIASETRRLLPLARAEALRRLGRLDEAMGVAAEAYGRLRANRRISVFDRVYLQLAAERFARIAEERGLSHEAKRIRTEAAAFRWHPNRIPR